MNEAVLYENLGVDQFVVGCIVDSINNPYVVCSTLGALEVAHIQPQAQYFYPLPTCGLCACNRRQLIFSLLVVGLSLAPALQCLCQLL